MLSMLTGDTRVFSRTIQLLTPAGLQPGVRGGPLQTGCPGMAGVKGSVGWTEAPAWTEGSATAVLRCAYGRDHRWGGPRQQVGGWVLPAPRGREPLDVVGGCTRVTCRSSGSPRLLRLSSRGADVGRGLSVSSMGSLDCLWVLQGLGGPGA